LSVTRGASDQVGSLITAETQQQNSTWSWRVNGFSEATERVVSNGTFEMLVGPPSGADFESSGASFASVHIHNRYIATIAYYGISGSVVLFIWLFTVARNVGVWVPHRDRHSPETHAATAFLQALLFSQLTYFVAYSGGITQGCITALIWLAATSPSRQTRHTSLATRTRFSYPVPNQ